MPALAAHLAQRAHGADAARLVHRTRLDSQVQANIESLAAEAAERLRGRVSVAIVVADSRDGSILAQVGSPGLVDSRQSGWIDMSIARRSPGPAPKPFIYGLAFEEGLAMSETLISDRPADFAGYRPRNFDMTFQGDVSAREALQLSLNVPATRLLDGIRPARLTALLRRGHADYSLARDGRPGLSIGLGGIGISLVDLVQIYTGLAVADGRPILLMNGVDGPAEALRGRRLLESSARWQVTDILHGVAPPAGTEARDIAYKTGTSYGYRDAWSVGYDGRYVIGVWVGRADNTAVPGMTGRSAAAPVPFRPPPAGTVRLACSDLPPAMRRYETRDSAFERHESGEAPPHIAYPPNGARVEVSRRADASLVPLVVKLQGGRPPFRWLANGRPLERQTRR